jgi:hypothetical protein
MAELLFNEEGSYGRGDSQKPSFITGLIIKIGIAKDERGATIILGALSLILIALALFFWFSRGQNTTATPSSETLKWAKTPQTLP